MSAAASAAPAAAPPAESLTLKVAQGSKQIVFRAKPGVSMAKLMKRYAEYTGTALETLRFVYDGQILKDEDTPKSLEMEDEDIIDVFSKHSGGCTQ